MNRVLKAVAFTLAVTVLPAAAFAQKPSLSDPSSLKEQAPATFKVRLDTSVGPIVIQVHRDWAPLGADRFYIGKTRTALLKVFTFGGLGYWWLIDIFITLFGGQREQLLLRLLEERKLTPAERAVLEQILRETPPDSKNSKK